MIRISESQTGTLFVTSANGSSRYKDETELPKQYRDALYLLRAADVGTRLDGVGVRISNNTYWIENGEEEK